MRRAGNAARLLKTAAVRQASTVSKAVSASALQRELGSAAAVARPLLRRPPAVTCRVLECRQTAEACARPRHAPVLLSKAARA